MGVNTVMTESAGETPATEVPMGDGDGRWEAYAVEPVVPAGDADGAEVAVREGRLVAVGAVDPTSDDWPADAGMTTVEYAIGTVVAAAFAAVLYRIVTGDSIVSALTDLIRRALSTAL